MSDAGTIRITARTMDKPVVTEGGEGARIEARWSEE